MKRKSYTQKNGKKNQRNPIEHLNSDISTNTQINIEPTLLLFDHRNLSCNLELSHGSTFSHHSCSQSNKFTLIDLHFQIEYRKWKFIRCHLCNKQLEIDMMNLVAYCFPLFQILPHCRHFQISSVIKKVFLGLV